MKVDMIMPQMGESITEATISRWIKSAGDRVEKDEIILEISTDKVDSEIPAPESGILSEVLFKEGDTVPVKERIAIIETNGAANGVAAAQPTPEKPKEPAKSAQPKPAESPAAPRSSAPVTTHSAASASDRYYSPLVRSLADKHGVSLSELDAVPGSGTGNRLTKNDLMTYLEQRGGEKPATKATQSSPTSVVTTPATPPAPKAPQPTYSAKPSSPVIDFPSQEWDANGVRIEPMDKMRQLIADHMVRSKATSPHVYSIQEVDVTQVSKYRAMHKKEFEAREGFGLSFTPFFLEAAVKALQRYPYVNSSVDGNKIILKKHINLGCAVALGEEGKGLIVPVIKRAEERNFVGIARALSDLAVRARDKKLLPDEVMDGTFTVTNPGVFGTMIGNPIINQPQVAILCTGAIKKRPVVIDDMIAIREICYLTLSYDHRIIDGALGGLFLKFVREYLENWDLSRPLY